MTRLTWARDRIEAPQLMPISGIVSVQEASDSHLTAGNSDDDLVVQRQRRAGHRITFHGVGDLLFPHHAATARVQGNQLVVERDNEHALAQHRYTAIKGIDLEGIDGLLLAMEPPDQQAASGID